MQKVHWLREGRGIYRLANYPETERPDLVYWSLWSRNRAGQPQGVFSHETARAIHDLSDAMPEDYHMIVPRAFRRLRPPPKNLVLHFTKLQEREILEMNGYRVTTPERTLRDVFEDETISEDLLIQAVADALEKGSVSRENLPQIKRKLRTASAKHRFTTATNEYY